jgi:hypothetical protein
MHRLADLALKAEGLSDLFNPALPSLILGQ